MAKKFNCALPADPCSTEEADNYYNTLISKHLSQDFIDRLCKVNSQALKDSEAEAQSNGAYYEEQGELKSYSERQIREALQFQKNINYYGTECPPPTWSLNDNL